MQRRRTILEQPAQHIALAKAAVAVLGESRVVGHLAVQPEPAEPTVGQVEVDLFAEPPLRADPGAVTHDQHAQQELRIDRGPPRAAVKGPEVLPHAVQVNKTVDGAEQVVRRHMPLQAEPVKQRLLRDRLLAHHQTHPDPPDRIELALPPDGNLRASLFRGALGLLPEHFKTLGGIGGVFWWPRP